LLLPPLSLPPTAVAVTVVVFVVVIVVIVVVVVVRGDLKLIALIVREGFINFFSLE
jgi:hypothetical protein